MKRAIIRTLRRIADAIEGRADFPPNRLTHCAGCGATDPRGPNRTGCVGPFHSQLTPSSPLSQAFCDEIVRASDARSKPDLRCLADDVEATVAERASPVFAINFKTEGGEPVCVHSLTGDQSYVGPTRECPVHGANPPAVGVTEDQARAIASVSLFESWRGPQVTSTVGGVTIKHPTSMADEVEKMRAEQESPPVDLRNSKFAPDYSNVEVPAVMRKRTAKNPNAKPARISPIRKPRG